MSIRINYLLTIDAVRKVQGWWRKAAPSIRDTYKCPVCINMHPVSRAVAGFSCNHIMCSTCYEAWTLQCIRENRASTCPTCRARQDSSLHNITDEYHRTLHDIWISSPATSVSEEIMMSALQHSYITNSLRDNIMLHPPTIQRIIRHTHSTDSYTSYPYNIINDIQDFISMRINNLENITDDYRHNAVQRATIN